MSPESGVTTNQSRVNGAATYLFVVLRPMRVNRRQTGQLLQLAPIKLQIRPPQDIRRRTQRKAVTEVPNRTPLQWKETGEIHPAHPFRHIRHDRNRSPLNLPRKPVIIAKSTSPSHFINLFS